MKAVLKAMLLSMGSLVLGACQMAPLSYLNGNPDRPLPMHEYPVHIVAVDQQAYLSGPVQVTPGKHQVLLQLKHSTSHVPAQKLMLLDVQPCTRYYLTATKVSIMDSKWEPRVFDSENVGGCKADEELKKAEASSAVKAVK